MKKQKVRAADFDSGKKRVNISMHLSDFEDLVLIAESKGIENPGTVALSILVTEVRKQAKELRKAGYLPGQLNMFEKKKGGKRGNR